MTPQLFWIVGPWPGRLAIATRPRGGDWLEDEASGWRKAAIDVVVSLLESDEEDQLDLLDEPKAARANGIHFVSFPIPDRAVPASLAAAISLMARIAAMLEEGKNVLLHCRQGIGRSGLMAAGILATSGISPGDAIQAVSAARGVAVPETQDQLLWVQGLRLKPPVVAR
jgi:protein-tyrosine phosphatase